MLLCSEEGGVWCVMWQPSVQPGECWAFNGSEGYLVVQLSAAIKVTEVSIEHIPVSLAPTGDIKSAPRDFTVWVSCCLLPSAFTAVQILMNSNNVSSVFCRQILLNSFAHPCHIMGHMKLDQLICGLLHLCRAHMRVGVAPAHTMLDVHSACPCSSAPYTGIQPTDQRLVYQSSDCCTLVSIS